MRYLIIATAVIAGLALVIAALILTLDIIRIWLLVDILSRLLEVE